MSDSSLNVIKGTWMVESREILPSIGIKGSLDFSIFTSFHWPRNCKSVKSLESPVKSTCNMHKPIEENGKQKESRWWKDT